MAAEFDIFELILSIIPFVFGLIAIGLVPSKEKILNNEVNKYKVETLMSVYVIALFIGIIGLYYLISIFGDGSLSQYLRVVNGIFLTVIALGIMSINYRNFSIYSEQKESLDIEAGYSPERTAAPELAEVHEVEALDEDHSIYDASHKQKKQVKKPEPEQLGCPKCGETITIMVTQRPLKIQCPHCGVEGIIK
jgi:DNA-directed RNA polymerase subunit RPC12/RpoP